MGDLLSLNIELKFDTENTRFQEELFGNFDQNIKRIEEFYGIDI